jgi:hypothetical protein
MAWRDNLLNLKRELAEVRAERRQQAAEDEAEHKRQLERLSGFASSLAISELLAEMNDVLLDGQGNIETFTPWDAAAEDTEEQEDNLFFDDEDTEEDEDLFTAILSWEEDGEREIVVDLGLTEEGFYLQVNEASIRLERRALEEALVRAFRDEMEL